MSNPNRHDFLPQDVRDEVAKLKSEGVRSSSAYEVVARSRGFKSYAALRARYKGDMHP